METFQITRMTPEGFERVGRSVPEEIPLTLEVNGNELATLLTSPSAWEDLAQGFLFTSGIITRVSEISGLLIDTDRFRIAITIERNLNEFVFKRIYTSGCGKGVIFHNPIDVIGKAPLPDGFQISAGQINLLMKQFLSGQFEHVETGGVHRASIASTEKLLVIREDIGRHNAIDKVIGACLAAGTDMSQTVLLVTGRVSSEIFSKVLRARIPVIASIGSPTNQAVKLARVTNITLISRLRGSRGEIFTGEHRIIDSGSAKQENTTFLA